MDKQLLIEMALFTPTRSYLNESMGGSNKMIVEGLIQKAETKNGNGRIYPYEVLKREADKYLAGPVKERRALGELDHPDSPVINLKNVSHNVVELWWKGKDLYGKIEVLPTPSGNILKELFKSGIKLGISSRGLGSVRQLGEGTVEVGDDFELIAFDFVSNPSTQGAFLHPTSNINESVNRNTVVNKYDKVNRLITDILTDIK